MSTCARMALATLALVAVVFAICAANSNAFERGVTIGVQQERDAKAQRDKMMRQVGVCDWAKVIADNIQCKRQLP